MFDHCPTPSILLHIVQTQHFTLAARGIDMLLNIGLDPMIPPLII
jgi:hypothetical protein